MENRRNYAPPIYNIRRVSEAPLPNLQAAMVVEMDAHAENVIQDQIDINNAAIPELENERCNNSANINLAANEGEVMVRNSDDVEIEHIKLEAPVLTLHETDDADFEILLFDESDPFEQCVTHTNEAVITHERNGENLTNDDQIVELVSADNLVHSNNIGVAGPSGLQRLVSLRPMTSVEPDDDDQPNANTIRRGEEKEDDFGFVLLNGVFPIPIAIPNHNLMKRDGDKLSGNIPYRNEVMHALAHCYCIAYCTIVRRHTVISKILTLFMITGPWTGLSRRK